MIKTHRNLFGLSALLFMCCTACTREPPDLKTLKADGYRHLRYGQLEAAATIAQKGAKLADKSTEKLPFQLLFAEVLIDQRQLDKATVALQSIIAASRTAADRGSKQILARALMVAASAQCLSLKGSEIFTRADQSLVQASNLALQIGATELMAEIAFHRGRCQLLANGATVAESHYREALTRVQKHGLKLLETRVVGEIGLLRIRTAHYDEALDWLKRALPLAKQLNAENLLCKILGNVGWCYFKLGDYERALSHLKRCYALAEKLQLPGDQVIALRNIGNAYWYKHKFDRAAEYHNRALAIARKLGNKDQIATILVNLGEINSLQGLYTSAATYIAEAQKIRVEFGDEIERLRLNLYRGEIQTGLSQYADAKALYLQVIQSPKANDELHWMAHKSLADLHTKLDQVPEALAEIQKALALREKSWRALNAAEHRIPYFTTLRQIYDRYVGLLVNQGQGTRALEVAESSRARLIRELLQKNTDQPSGTRAAFQRIAAGLNAVFLVYWTGPDRSFMWIVTPRSIETKILPDEKSLERDIDAYQKVILQSRDPLQEKNPLGQQLWRTLIEPAAERLYPGVRVVMVPDGPLHRLNAETLVVPDGGAHYWIEDVTLAVAPSLNILRMDQDPPSIADSKILLMGDPISANEEYPRLAHAALEIEKLAELFGPRRRSVYTERNVHPGTYRDAKPTDYAYIHIVAHVMDNYQNPLKSAIVVSPKDDLYRLYAEDIVDIPLRAELVSLPGCQSAGTRAFSGEGLVGLSWAFLRAGAKRFIGGLWNVEDASSAELMSGMYRGVNRGQDPIDALRDAKLELLQSDSAYKKPYYWAPFVAYLREHSAAPKDVGK